MSELNNDVTPLSFWPRPERAEPTAESAGEAAAGPAETADVEPAETVLAAEAEDAEDAEPAGAHGDSAAWDDEPGGAAEVTEDEPAAELELDLAASASTGSTADRSGTYGHPEVDAVVERLDELDQLETTDHVEVYEDAHRRLHQALLAAGDDQAGAGAGDG